MSAFKEFSPSFQSTIWPWATLNYFSILLILSVPLVTAINPISVYGMAYATINEEKLIIQGGVDYQTPILAPNVNQFMMLDLTLPTWDAINPPWSNVPHDVDLPENLTTAAHSMSVSPDRITLIIWDPNSPGSLTSFNMSSKLWTLSAVPAGLQSSLKELKAATNPLTGKVYIPLGDGNFNMLVWDPVTSSSGTGAATVGPTPSGAAPDGTSPSGVGTVGSELMPDAVKAGMNGYTWTWCPSRKTFILFGGRPGADPTAPYLHEFQPKGSKWTVMNTTGTVPPRMRSSCMEPAYKGTKMILFGGIGTEQVATGSIYILDLPTMVWSQGPNVHPLQNRSHMACGVSGDSFVVFGGIRRTGPDTILKVDATPLIYNINSDMWVPRFDRKLHIIESSSTSTKPTKPAQPTEITPEVSPSSGVSDGAIVGVVSAVIVAIGAVISFLVYKRRREGGTSEVESVPHPSTDSPQAPPIDELQNDSNSSCTSILEEVPTRHDLQGINTQQGESSASGNTIVSPAGGQTERSRAGMGEDSSCRAVAGRVAH